MGALYPFRAYLRYKRKAVSKHGVHSPFVFELITKVFPPKKGEDFSQHPAEVWRRECLANHNTINVTDFGTGTSGARKISDIAAKSAKSAREGQLLFRIIRHFQPAKILELGTSLGITMLYEASATPFELFMSLEGCPETAKVGGEGYSKYLFNKLREERTQFKGFHPNLLVVTGEFEKQLNYALTRLNLVDFVFFDGNHREEPTLKYFETCLPYSHKNSVFVFDDIHWSEEMERAWEKIKAHEKVRLTIDLFHFGIVFFREQQKEKEHFVLKY